MQPDTDHEDLPCQKRLSVFIVDDQPLFRQAIRQTLGGEIEVVGETPADDDVWTDIESIVPDIALVDIGLPLLSGISVARQITRHCPRAAVVVLSSNPDDEQLFQAIKAGAAAFVSKNATAEDLTGILRKVARGQYPINQSLLDRPGTALKILRLFHDLTRRGCSVDGLLTPLSPREVEVLRHIANGNTNRQIASKIGIGEQSVKNYITSIMRKLNANDRTHAVVLAIRNGWLDVAQDNTASRRRYRANHSFLIPNLVAK